jgi:hypothetical protein
MEKMAFHFGAEGTISNLNFRDRRSLTIDHIQFHKHPHLARRTDFPPPSSDPALTRLNIPWIMTLSLWKRDILPFWG